MNARMGMVCFVFAVLLGAFDIQAANTASCEVLTISATKDGRGVDPALGAYAHIFKQKPFSTFNTFTLVGRQVLNLKLSVPKKLSLPDSLGGTLRLNRFENDKLKLTLTLIRKGKKPININGSASPGAPFFAAGLSKSDGVWIFGVRCSNDGIVSH